MALQLVLTNFIRALFPVSGRTPSEENSRKSEYFGKDHISELPDEILASILAYLTVKDAVKTRVLSRRWRHLRLSYLQASRSNLNFDYTWAGLNFSVQSRECRPYTFVQGVNMFLSQYKGPNIGSFRVAFCLGRKFASDIDRWITYAVKLGVEQLAISGLCYAFSHCKEYEFYAFSFRLLSEASELKRLQLHSCVVKWDFDGQFHSLKFLRLSCTRPDQSILLFILLRCCNLEELILNRCLCPAVLSFRGPFLQLNSLTVSVCQGLEEIELSATNLTTLEVASSRVNFNIWFSRVPSLENVYCHEPFGSGFPDDLFSKIGNAVPQLQSLIVANYVEWLKYFPSSISTLGNFRKLEFFLSAGTNPYDIRKIIPVLTACPLLQIFNLTIKPSVYLYNFFNIEERTMKEICECRLPELKEVEISGFQGTETQFELALYLLKNAVTLEQMVITSCLRHYVELGKYTYHEVEPWTDRMHKRIIDRLEGKAASKNARLTIYKGDSTIWSDFQLQPVIIGPMD